MGVVFVVVMKALRTKGIVMLAGFGLAKAATAWAADVAANPYHVISERNLFHLRAAPPTVGCEPARVDPPSVGLTGITTILGTKMAFITIAAVRPGQTAQSVMLGVGQAFEDVEVKGINERNGIVEIVNHGQVQFLDINDPGVKPLDHFEEHFERPVISDRAPKSVERDDQRLTAEDRVALIELQRAKYLQENDPTSKILPPTELTAEILGQ